MKGLPSSRQSPDLPSDDYTALVLGDMDIDLLHLL